MGLANIIPGVSGATLAIILGIYEDLISSISHLLKDLKKNLAFLIPIGVGMVLSFGIMSGVIEYAYKKFPILMMMFFVGLVLGGVPMLLKNVKKTKDSKKVSSYLIGLCTFTLVIVMSLGELIFGTSSVDFAHMGVIGYILLFLIGVASSATMVVPGVSGSLMLMVTGYYLPILATVHSLFKFENLVHNIIICAVFGIGMVVGIIFISKLIEMLLKKYKVKTYFGVIGFILASSIAIPISTILKYGNLELDLLNAALSIVVLVLGFTISYKLGDK